MISRIIQLALLPVIAMFAACGGDTTGPETGQEFPNTTGNTWVYAVQRLEPLPLTTDTIVIAIVLRTYTPAPGEPPDTTMSTRAAMVWEVRASDRTDSVLVLRYTSTAVANPMRLTGRTPLRVISFPLAVGAAWATPNGRDSVTAKGPITVPAGTFQNAFTIEGYYDSGVSWHRYTFVPFVGVVAREVRETVDTTQTVERWELVRYALM